MVYGVYLAHWITEEYRFCAGWIRGTPIAFGISDGVRESLSNMIVWGWHIVLQSNRQQKVYYRYQ